MHKLVGKLVSFTFSFSHCLCLSSFFFLLFRTVKLSHCNFIYKPYKASNNCNIKLFKLGPSWENSIQMLIRALVSIVPFMHLSLDIIIICLYLWLSLQDSSPPITVNYNNCFLFDPLRSQSPSCELLEKKKL